MQCRDGNKVVSNCCWGGKSPKDNWSAANLAACIRQLKSRPEWDVQRSQCEFAEIKLKSKQESDCCDTITKYGVGCPKK